MRRKKKKTFTKGLLIFDILVSLVLTAACIAEMVIGGGVASSELVTLTGMWIAETGAFSTFYIWKSKNENVHKYKQHWINTIAKDYGIEYAVRLAESERAD